MLRTVTRAWRAHGFALLEAIVAIVMLAILAAAIVPLVAGAEDRARAEATVRDLDHLKSAIDEFKARIGVYPSQLNHTVEPIVPGGKNSCGNNYGVAGRNNWANNDASYGPWFRERMIVSNFGLPTGVGFIEDDMTRTADTLVVSLIDVPEAAALELDLIIDSTITGTGPTVGEIRWGTIVDGVTTVRYSLLRPGC
jgi:type II secretory pathway pseudopilin PulG